MATMRNESIWFEQPKYESAEATCHASLADRYLGLSVEGKAIALNPISTEIEKAMDLIDKSLKSNSSSVSSIGTADLERRVLQLEEDNISMKSTLKEILSRLSFIDGANSSKKDNIATDSGADDDFDLFASEDEETTRVKLERLEEYTEKKNMKPRVVAKSSLILDVKPWDDETVISEIETQVRSITAAGLLWGASKILPVAYGIKKLQISCVIEDDKIGTDFLEESILAFEDLVQSVDIIAFNKI